jgi:hypothetical protein
MNRHWQTPWPAHAYEKAKTYPRIAEAVKARKESLERSRRAGITKKRQTRTVSSADQDQDKSGSVPKVA